MGKGWNRQLAVSYRSTSYNFREALKVQAEKLANTLPRADGRYTWENVEFMMQRRKTMLAAISREAAETAKYLENYYPEDRKAATKERILKVDTPEMILIDAAQVTVLADAVENAKRGAKSGEKEKQKPVRDTSETAVRQSAVRHDGGTDNGLRERLDALAARYLENST